MVDPDHSCLDTHHLLPNPRPNVSRGVGFLQTIPRCTGLLTEGGAAWKVYLDKGTKCIMSLAKSGLADAGFRLKTNKWATQAHTYKESLEMPSTPTHVTSTVRRTPKYYHKRLLYMLNREPTDERGKICFREPIYTKLHLYTKYK